MAIFDQQTSRSGDAATRALSVTTVGTDFVEKVYQNIAQVYDYTYGPTLHPGRLEAIKKMRIRPGTEILEVGVGTGINLSLYPKASRVTGIDLSSKMLAKAQKRIDEKNLDHCDVIEMDATKLQFADNSFDVVYAPYVISVVPDPVAVAKEMYRVCRPGGRVVILNHFHSLNPIMAKIETAPAIATFDDILRTAEGIMVARGDLGVEVGPALVPLLQKRIIARALDRGKPVITATQMLESMMHQAEPTRAEASDVANAVLDGTDAVMLSGETSVGEYPIETVETMARIRAALEAAGVDFTK